MIVRNFLETPSEIKSIHEGKGTSKTTRVFNGTDFDTPLRFIDYLEMEPGSSIGNHRHGENEEVYVVLSGSGVMVVNDERRAVKTGDVILNKPGWVHGLENTAQEPPKLFVFEVDQRSNQ